MRAPTSRAALREKGRLACEFVRATHADDTPDSSRFKRWCGFVNARCHSHDPSDRARRGRGMRRRQLPTRRWVATLRIRCRRRTDITPGDHDRRAAAVPWVRPGGLLLLAAGRGANGSDEAGKRAARVRGVSERCSAGGQRWKRSGAREREEREERDRAERAVEGIDDCRMDAHERGCVRSMVDWMV